MKVSLFSVLIVGSLCFTGIYAQYDNLDNLNGIIVSKHFHSHVFGGQKVDGLDRYHCIVQCNNTKGCISVDYDQQQGCYMFIVKSNVHNGGCPGLYGRRGTTHYKLFACSNNRHILTGELQFNIKSRVDCIEYCRQEARCLAADFHNNQGCYFHYRTTACRPMEVLYLSTSYRRTNCTDLDPGSLPTIPSDVVTTETSTVVPTTTTVTSSGPTQDLDTTQGDPGPSPTFPSDTQDPLITQGQLSTTPRSFGFANRRVNSGSSSGSSNNNIEDLSSFNAPTRYPEVKIPSSVIATFAGSHLEGGVPQVNINDLNTCLRTCDQSSSCRAADFNRVNSECWFHYDETNCNVLMSDREVTHYKFILCERNRHYQNGTRVFGLTSPSLCLDRCISSTRCQGADFNSIDSTCWHHDYSTVCGQGIDRIGVQHFKKISCKDTTSVTESANTRYTTPYVNNNILFTLRPIVLSEYLKPQVFSDVHARGGTLIKNARTFQTCAELCTGLFRCHAFDFDFKYSQCYMHTDQSACAPLIYKEGTMHVKRVRCSGTTTRPSFTIYRQSHVRGAKIEPIYTTFKACADACAQTATCRAVDFNFVSQVCYFHGLDSACGALVQKEYCIHAKKKLCELSPYELRQRNIL